MTDDNTQTIEKQLKNPQKILLEPSNETSITTVIEPHLEEVNGAELFEEIKSTIRKYIILNDEQVSAIALWIIFSYTIECSPINPRLLIMSPEKRCGKSCLLRVLTHLSNKPFPVSNASPASLFRIIEQEQPTLIIDEADSFMKGNEDLRNIVNSGHDRDFAFVLRVEGVLFTPKKFSTFSPMVIAGIGKQADTIMDRSVIISMRRKRKGEKVARLGFKEKAELKLLSRKIKRWALDNRIGLERMGEPYIPETLNDRARDNWYSLFQIATLLGCDATNNAWQSAIALSGKADNEESMGTLLLADIKEFFEKENCSRATSEDICIYLNDKDERPWNEWGKFQKPMQKQQLAKQLNAFEIKPKNLRINGGVLKGYEKSAFEDAFSRYLPS